MLSNYFCIEIVDNKYIIITNKVKNHNIKEDYAK